jgi:precorrin-6A/cobalt-precorrin-6A reductase
MILVLGGTAESRALTEKLLQHDFNLIICTATTYGTSLLKDYTKTSEVITGRLDEKGLVNLISAKNVRVLIDATHPFAEIATANAMNACKQTGILYLRFVRPAMTLPDHPLIFPVTGYEQAAVRAVELAGKTIFITTGTKTLQIFADAAYAAGLRLITRILPDPAGLRLCIDLGIPPRDIVAMQGPFSVAMNKLLLTEYETDVLVTKESGIAGGSDTKIQAALDLSLPVVVIKRPPDPVGTISDLDELIEKLYTHERTEGR